MTRISLRPAQTKDCERLLDLEDSIFGKHCNHIYFLKPLLEYGQSYILEGKHGEWMGYALIFHESCANSVHLLSFAVLPPFQGKGLGGQFYKALLDALRRDGVASLSLSVAPQNQRALALYRNPGLYSSLDEELRMDYYGPGENRILFRFTL